MKCRSGLVERAWPGLQPRRSGCRLLCPDGLSAFAPYYLDERGWGMDQAFMLIERAPRTDPPSDAELAAMGMKRDQANKLLAKLKARHDAALRFRD